MKKTIYMMKGLPASGKSTWAKEFVKGRQDVIRVSNDDLRLLMFNRAFSKPDTKHISIVRESMIQYAIDRGLSVVIDNCNLHPKHHRNYSELAVKYNYNFEVKDFTSTPLGECIRRDKLRDGKVGAWVIVDMYNHFLRGEDEPFLEVKDVKIPDAPKGEVSVLKQDYNLPHAVICDLDGTLALFDRDPYDASDCDKDRANLPVLNVLMMARQHMMQIIFVSGRMEKYGTPTRKFLREKCGLMDNQYLLFMRKDDDFRKDSIIKSEIYENFIRGKWYVDFVLDDRDQVVKFWRSVGLTCFQVAEGNF
jgi:predicted kinase